ncbi:EAL domain-containing protein [Massilia sp. G4R7]|uniref:EAL domain-containing protein n=1 Tax=Massilia phyllostachyos TaxID=2898585 RepID=A0ABS8Q6X9_9BURK|nr:EAL domain-containing protein [Massilia phyllostachyos]MCD2517521.1 EAL domain-containing protein [Massilia phyllostachyos]
MHIVTQVVTTDEGERARLSLLFQPAAGDLSAIVLRFAATLEEAACVPPPFPDLLLLAPTDDDGAGMALPVSPAVFGNAAVVIVGDAIDIAGTRRLLTSGLADDVMLSSDSRSDTFARFVAVIERVRARERERNGAAIVLAAMADAVIATDEAGTIAYCNDAACSLTVRARKEMLGLPIDAVMALHAAGTLAAVEHPITRAMNDKQAIRLPPGTVMVRVDGSEIMIADSTSPIVAPDGKLDGAVMVFHDVTATHQLQSQVDYLARHDFLTGLPNRYAAQLHLAEILRQAGANGQGLAAMYLDLDNFKSINDTLGHAAGDRLLASVATRLRACCRSIDMVSRQGGDEFLILLAPGTQPDESRGAAQRMLEAVAAPHLIDGATMRVGCSIGIALHPQHGLAADTLLQHADTALHAAKAAGRNTFNVFQPRMLDSVAERRALEDALRLALDTGGLELFYQPKVCLADGAIHGCESLLRWRHPDWTRFAIAEVIRCAEQSGLIVNLGRWVMHEAMRQARAWRDSGIDPGPIAINVSALELRQADFIAHLEGCMARFGVLPPDVQIELTESALMRDVASAVDVLHRLKGLGMSIALDDFGTGYSNLSYLADIPIDLLKVDRSFVHGIAAASPRRQALLGAVLSVAAHLGLPTVAEGIETPAEALYLMNAGCQMGQGFLYSPAVSAAAFERLLSHRENP